MIIENFTKFQNVVQSFRLLKSLVVFEVSVLVCIFVQLVFESVTMVDLRYHHKLSYSTVEYDV